MNDASKPLSWEKYRDSTLKHETQYTQNQCMHTWNACQEACVARDADLIREAQAEAFLSGRMEQHLGECPLCAISVEPQKMGCRTFDEISAELGRLKSRSVTR